MANYITAAPLTNINDFHQVWVKNDSSELMYTDNNGKDHRVDLLIERLEAVEKKLAILEDPTPEQLEKHKMLKEVYTKYKFIEGLCSEEDES